MTWASLFLAVLVLAMVLLVVCYLRPAVGRLLARVVAVVSMGLGVGGLVWGIVAAARGDQPSAEGVLAGATPSFVIGCGAGFLTAGVVALVLSWRQQRTVPPKDSSPT